MKRLFSSIKKNPLLISNNAWNKMGEIITTKNAKSFIFSCIGSGCNGYSYQLKLLNKEEYKNICDKHKLITILKKNDIKLVIDPMVEIYLLGTKIDYIYEDYNKSIFESKFIFKPDKNLASSCGCGISFSPKI